MSTLDKVKLLVQGGKLMDALKETKQDWDPKKTVAKGLKVLALDVVRLVGILVIVVISNPDFVSHALVQLGVPASVVIAAVPLITAVLVSWRNAEKHKWTEALEAVKIKEDPK